MVVIAAVSAAALLIQLRVAILAIKADHERRRKQATIEYVAVIWRDTRLKLEAEYGFDQLTQDQMSQIRADHKKEAEVRHHLGVLEHMATGLHTGVYDKDLLYRMAATFVIQTYRRLKPYIEHMQKDFPTAYIEFARLAEEFDKRKRKELANLGDMRTS
jgi:hypothetical protein